MTSDGRGRLRGWHLLGAAAVLLALAVAALDRVDLRRGGSIGPPRVEYQVKAQGALRAGAAEVPIEPPYPVPVAGYPNAASADTSVTPLASRALALQVGEAKLTLVSVDLLEVPETLVTRLRKQFTPDLGALWVCATHAHSSVGGYDPNPVAELSGAGRYRTGIELAVLTSLGKAVRGAWTDLRPARLGWAQGEVPGTVNRWGDDLPVDRRLWRVEVTAADGHRIAEVIRAAGHPTLAGRSTVLDGDWPAELATSRERDGGVTLVVQGAGGDASIDRQQAKTPKAYAQLLSSHLPEVDGGLEQVTLGVDAVAVDLPKVEVGLAPPWIRLAASNVVDRYAPRVASVEAAEIGPVHLLAIPAEVTGAAAPPLEGEPAGWAAVTLCNAYLGYVETPEAMAAGRGESARTDFGPQLLEVLSDGTRAARDALEKP